MKTELSKTDIAKLVKLAPIAAGSVITDPFWDEVEQRAELREKHTESLVEKRPTK